MKKAKFQTASVKPSKKDIENSVKDGYVIFYDIKWDTDGASVKDLGLPKSVRVLKTEFEKDFDFAIEGADYLSDEFGYCIHSFSFQI